MEKQPRYQPFLFLIKALIKSCNIQILKQEQSPLRQQQHQQVSVTQGTFTVMNGRFMARETCSTSSPVYTGLQIGKSGESAELNYSISGKTIQVLHHLLMVMTLLPRPNTYTDEAADALFAIRTARLRWLVMMTEPHPSTSSTTGWVKLVYVHSSAESIQSQELLQFCLSTFTWLSPPVQRFPFCCVTIIRLLQIIKIHLKSGCLCGFHL